MEFFIEYGLFLAKAVTVLVVVVVIIGAIFSQASKGSGGASQNKGHITVQKLNDQFDDYQDILEHNTSCEAHLKKLQKQKKKQAKLDKKQANEKPKVYVLQFEGDVRASAVENLRQEINALLTVLKKGDEVVLNLESPGGMVHTYGLAASQLSRIKQSGATLTVAVDKVAASGGYLMACVADKIIAAPFAIIGSIGVLAQVPNIHNLLKKYDIDYDIYTAGEHKAPISLMGEITDKGKKKLNEELEETHQLFKQFITTNRVQVPIEKVATGEVWYGQQAIDQQLIDALETFDDYLINLRNSHDIFQITYEQKRSLPERIGLSAAFSVSHLVNKLWDKEQATQIFQSSK